MTSWLWNQQVRKSANCRLHLGGIHSSSPLDNKFPPTKWTSFTLSVLRITNACEAFHSKLNGMFYYYHSNIFRINQRSTRVSRHNLQQIVQFLFSFNKIIIVWWTFIITFKEFQKWSKLTNSKKVIKFHTFDAFFNLLLNLDFHFFVCN